MTNNRLEGLAFHSFWWATLAITAVLALPAHAQPLSGAMLPQKTASQSVGTAPYYLLSKASGYMQEGKDASALAPLFEAVEQDPVNVLAQFHMGLAYLELSRKTTIPAQQAMFIKIAKEAFERVVDLNPELTLTYFKLGKIALIEGKLDEAKRIYRLGLEADPYNAALMFNLARVYDQSHDKAQAAEFYAKTLSADPKFVYAYNNLGLLNEEQSNWKEAERFYKQALKHDPEYNLPRLNLANLYASRGQYDLAEPLFTEALSREPKNAWIHFYQGNMYLRMQQYVKAVSAYNQASELDPDNSTTYYLLAVSLSKLQRMDEALQASLHYVELEPEGEYAKEMKSLILAVKFSQGAGYLVGAPTSPNK